MAANERNKIAFTELIIEGGGGVSDSNDILDVEN